MIDEQGNVEVSIDNQNVGRLDLQDLIKVVQPYMILSAPKFGKSMVTLELLIALGLITSVMQKTRFRNNLYSKLRKIRQ